MVTAPLPVNPELRTRVLAVLRDAAGPLSTAEIREELGDDSTGPEIGGVLRVMGAIRTGKAPVRWTLPAGLAQPGREPNYRRRTEEEAAELKRRDGWLLERIRARLPGSPGPLVHVARLCSNRGEPVIVDPWLRLLTALAERGEAHRDGEIWRAGPAPVPPPDPTDTNEDTDMTTKTVKPEVLERVCKALGDFPDGVALSALVEAVGDVHQPAVSAALKMLQADGLARREAITAVKGRWYPVAAPVAQAEQDEDDEPLSAESEARIEIARADPDRILLESDEDIDGLFDETKAMRAAADALADGGDRAPLIEAPSEAGVPHSGGAGAHEFGLDDDCVRRRCWAIDGRPSAALPCPAEIDAAEEADARPTAPAPTAAPDTSKALALAALTLRLGRTDRITRHPDGTTPESVTDHTVMLATVAAEFAPARLDRGRILAYALVHDLPEAYAGDTPTLVALDADARAAKDAREAAALDRIRSEVGPDSWVVRTIEAYERQADREARWVHALDKCCPKLTHALNGGIAVRAQGVDLSHVRERVVGQLAEIGPDLGEARALGEALLAEVERTWTEGGEAAPVARPLWYVWLTEYEDEGAAVITAATREEAARRGADLIAEGEVEAVSVRPVFEADVDELREKLDDATRTYKAAEMTPAVHELVTELGATTVSMALEMAKHRKKQFEGARARFQTAERNLDEAVERFAAVREALGCPSGVPLLDHAKDVRAKAEDAERLAGVRAFVGRETAETALAEARAQIAAAADLLSAGRLFRTVDDERAEIPTTLTARASNVAAALAAEADGHTAARQALAALREILGCLPGDDLLLHAKGIRVAADGFAEATNDLAALRDERDRLIAKANDDDEIARLREDLADARAAVRTRDERISTLTVQRDDARLDVAKARGRVGVLEAAIVRRFVDGVEVPRG